MSTRTLKDLETELAVEPTGLQTIRRALEALKAVGPEHWVYEHELQGDPYRVSPNSLGRYRKLFLDHIVTVPGSGSMRCRKRHVWFGSIAAAAKFRDRRSSDE